MMATTALILDTGMIMITLILVDSMATINLVAMILGMEDFMTFMDIVRIIMDSTTVLMMFQISMALSMVLRKLLMGMDLIMQIAMTSTLTTMVSIITSMVLIMSLVMTLMALDLLLVMISMV